MLLIAAGVGITPIRALLEDTPTGPGTTTLVYRYTDEPHAIFKPEIDQLAARRNDGSWQPQQPGARQTDDAEALRRLVPDIAQADIFVCGPSRWVTAVRKAAMAAGAQRRDIHSEDFAW